MSAVELLPDSVVPLSVEWQGQALVGDDPSNASRTQASNQSGGDANVGVTSATGQGQSTGVPPASASPAPLQEGAPPPLASAETLSASTPLPSASASASAPPPGPRASPSDAEGSSGAAAAGFGNASESASDGSTAAAAGSGTGASATGSGNASIPDTAPLSTPGAAAAQPPSGIGIAVGNGSAGKACGTIGQGGQGPGHPCVLPFTYKGVKHNSCTGVESNTTWCATQVDVDGNYLDQTTMWGQCSVACPVEAPGAADAQGQPDRQRISGIVVFLCCIAVNTSLAVAAAMSCFLARRHSQIAKRPLHGGGAAVRWGSSEGGWQSGSGREVVNATFSEQRRSTGKAIFMDPQYDRRAALAKGGRC